MDHEYRTEKQFAGSPILANQFSSQGIASKERDISPVEKAINRLSEEIDEIHCQVDLLIVRADSALRPSSPEVAKECGRSMGQSKLDDSIEQLTESLRAARFRLNDAIDRLTI